MEPAAAHATMPSHPIGPGKRRIRRVFTRGFLRAILFGAPIAFLLPYLTAAFFWRAHEDAPQAGAALGAAWILAGVLAGVVAAVRLPRHPVKKEGQHNGAIAALGSVLAAYAAAWLFAYLARQGVDGWSPVELVGFAAAYLDWLLEASIVAAVAGFAVGRQRAGTAAFEED